MISYSRNFGDTVPLVMEMDPALEPWQAFQKLYSRLVGVLFLDSAMQHRQLGRYSYITADPFHLITVSSKLLPESDGIPPFSQLKGILDNFPAPSVEGLPPFQGGAAGLFSYDLGRYLEQIPAQSRVPFPIPEMVVGIYDWVLAFDHVLGRSWIISQGFPERVPATRHLRACERMEEILTLLEAPISEETHVSQDPQSSPGGETFKVDGYPGLLSNFKKEDYLAAVRRAIEYIYAGDIFQVNLSQQLFYPCKISPLELYKRLRERNPATFAAYFAPPGFNFILLSASPERFLRVTSEGVVETRPIKGTRPRKFFAEEDRFVRDELRESAKDRSENVMIVDLLRNDLSRVCKPGSLTVPGLFGVETYPSIHHLVSVVRGDLAEDAHPLDLLEAAFPGGSVTGAPKIRAMEIIAELEPDSRGAYCGSLGTIGFNGTMDTSILIRTVTATEGWLRFPVGGGIVADSSPEREYQETLDKASGILRALYKDE